MKTETETWYQEEITRLIRLIDDLNVKVGWLSDRLRSCEVDIDRLERNKQDS